MTGVWESVKEYLRSMIPEAQYELWINPIELGESDSDRVVLVCPNEFHRDWVSAKLGKEIVKAWAKRGIRVPVVMWKVKKGNGNEPEAVSDTEETPETDFYSNGYQRPPTAVQIPLGKVFSELNRLRLNRRFTFEQFVVGDTNRFAYSATNAIAKGQSFYNNALYILADPGLGKSHLSQAVGNYLLDSQANVRLCYLTAEEFANEMIAALRAQHIEKFKEKYREKCDLLILEKVEFLSGKMKMQTEFAYTLDFLLDSGKRFICTSNYYPKDIPKLRKDLRSRLSGVLITPIEPPDFETRVKIVSKKAENEGMKLPPRVVEFLAERLTKDVRQIESCIAGLILKSRISERSIDLALAREVLDTMEDCRPGITIEQIKKVVARSFRIRVEDLSSPSRKRMIAYPRSISMYLCQEYTTDSLTVIGKAFNRSHSTVIYSVNRLKKEMESSLRTKKEVEFIRNEIETNCLREDRET